MAVSNRTITIQFKVSIKEHLPHNLAVAVSGNNSRLGDWNPHKVEVLQRIEKSLDGEVWSKDIVINPQSSQILFRYVIAEVLDFNDEDDSRLVKILKWETNLMPRTLETSDVLLSNDVRTHVFGSYDGQTKVEHGWLTGQHEIHLRIYGEAIKWFKPRHRNRKLYLTCRQVLLKRDQMSSESWATDNFESSQSLSCMFGDDDETRDSLGASRVSQIVTYSVLRNDGSIVCSNPAAPDACEFQPGNYLTFRTQVMDYEAVTLEFEVFVGAKQTRESNERCEPRLVGTIRTMPFEHLAGIKSFHIFGNNRRVIGQMRVDYLIINSLSQTRQLLDTTYSKHWTDYGILKIGHRGSGASYTSPDEKVKKSAVKENTLRSLRTAFEHGADYVEFDVHLSKDKIPVVYHDFKVVLTLKKKRKQDHSYMEVAVKDLTLDELQALKVSPSGVLGAGHSNEEMTEEEPESLDTLAFCTLNQVFEHFKANNEFGGFNIEVKYPLMLQNGVHEQDYYFERNESLDIILKEVFRSAGNRRIIFSSFDPDTCTMLRLKQNKYPVLFLSQGITPKYTPYMDPRTHSLTMSVLHAVDNNILGVCVFHEEFQKNETIIKMIRDNNLVVFVWGSDIDNNDDQQHLKSMRVNGIIFDRIHEVHQRGTDNVFSGRIASVDGAKSISTSSLSGIKSNSNNNCSVSLNGNGLSADEPSPKRTRTE